MPRNIRLFVTRFSNLAFDPFLCCVKARLLFLVSLLFVSFGVFSGDLSSISQLANSPERARFGSVSASSFTLESHKYLQHHMATVTESFPHTHTHAYLSQSRPSWRMAPPTYLLTSREKPVLQFFSPFVIPSLSHACWFLL